MSIFPGVAAGIGSSGAAAAATGFSPLSLLSALPSFASALSGPAPGPNLADGLQEVANNFSTGTFAVTGSGGGQINATTDNARPAATGRGPDVVGFADPINSNLLLYGGLGFAAFLIILKVAKS
jgi:hypothetical protein